MRVRLHSISLLAAALAVAGTYYAPHAQADGGGGSQLSAMADAQRLNKQGSDESLQNSTTSAMQAMMDLANQKVPSAISNGYKAYGQYSNSGSLDGLRIQNAISALQMNSLNHALPPDLQAAFVQPLSSYETSYRRLDPGFLNKGEAAGIAAEFEKQTGMSRKDFLNRLAKASESTISASDPMLVDKVLSRFQAFAKDIPNAAFRAKLEKEIDRVPSTMRTGIIAKALQKAATMVAAEKGGAKIKLGDQ